MRVKSETTIHNAPKTGKALPIDNSTRPKERKKKIKETQQSFPIAENETIDISNPVSERQMPFYTGIVEKPMHAIHQHAVRKGQIGKTNPQKNKKE
jgi:hypothetical protein